MDLTVCNVKARIREPFHNGGLAPALKPPPKISLWIENRYRKLRIALQDRVLVNELATLYPDSLLDEKPIRPW